MDGIDLDRNGRVHAYEACLKASPVKYFCDEQLKRYYSSDPDITIVVPDILKTDQWRAFLPNWYLLDRNHDEIITELEYRTAYDQIYEDDVYSQIQVMDTNQDSYVDINEGYTWYSKNHDKIKQAKQALDQFIPLFERVVNADQIPDHGIAYSKSSVEDVWSQL